MKNVKKCWKKVTKRKNVKMNLRSSLIVKTLLLLSSAEFSFCVLPVVLRLLLLDLRDFATFWSQHFTFFCVGIFDVWDQMVDEWGICWNYFFSNDSKRFVRIFKLGNFHQLTINTFFHLIFQLSIKKIIAISFLSANALSSFSIQLI